MMRKISFLIAFLIITTASFSQSTDAKITRRPDIPGTFVVELGVNRAQNAPNAFDIGLWGSRTVNIYYQYDIRILKSRFSFVPGIGLGLERYRFRNGRILGFDDTDSLTMLTSNEAGFPGLRRSQLITNYVDIPVELRYSSKPEDPARSFRIAVGGRVGYLYDAFTKVKYRENGEMKQIKDNQNFNLNRIRYGVYGKVGIGNFSLFGYYNLSNLFQDGEGLTQSRTYRDFNTFTVGISLSSF